MKLSKDDIEIAKQNKSQFVSLKYLGDDGKLKQIDISINNIDEALSLVDNNEINLKTIKNKSFIDPFRSFPTTSFLCENIASKHNMRQLLIELSPTTSIANKSLAAEISFFVEGEDLSNNYKFAADQVDPNANLRSDIINTLENINIKTGIYFHGSNGGESVITIKGEDIIDLSDNILIAKFIIANVTDSYGLKAKFIEPNNRASNINLLIQGTQTNIEELPNIIEKNIKQIDLLAKNNNFSILKLKKTYLYVTNTSNIMCKISLVCEDSFDPYITFAALLFYKSHKEFFVFA